MKKLTKKTSFKLFVIFNLLLIPICFQNLPLNRINWKSYENSPINITANLELSTISSWSKSWGNLNDDDIVENMVRNSITGDLYFTGATNKSGTNYDLLLIKYNKDGTLIWNVTWDSNYDDYGKDVAIDETTGDVYVTGVQTHTTEFDNAITLKFDATGDYKWNRTYHSSYDRGYAIAMGPSGNVIVIGDSNSNIFVANYTPSKTIIWEKEYDITGNFDSGKDIVINSDGSFYVTGTKGNFMMPGYATLVKFNSSGDAVWHKELSVSSSSTMVGYALAKDSEDYIYVTGRDSIEPNNRLLLAKFKDEGASATEKWAKAWIESASDQYWGEDILIDSANTPYVAIHLGTPNSSLIVRKYTNSGTLSSEIKWDGGNSNAKFPRGVVMDSNYHLYIVGITATGTSNENDIQLVMIDLSSGGTAPPDNPWMLIIILVSVGAAIGVGSIVAYNYLKKRKE